MRTRDILRQAKKDGRSAGLAAASWVFDGNTTLATYRRTLEGLRDGDPAVYDAFRSPDLSGEWADAPTPATLADDYGIDEARDPDGDLLDEVCDVWQAAADAAFWTEIERVCRFHVEG